MELLKLDIADRVIAVLSIVTTILILLNDIGYIPSIPYYVTAPLLLGSLYYCVRKGSARNRYAMRFLIFIPISLLFANPDPVFRSWQRLAFFLLVFLVASPLFVSEKLTTYRRNCVLVFLRCCSIIGIISFFAYFLGISWMTIDEDSAMFYMERAGYFSGITKQSMMLGPIAGLGALLNYSEFESTKKKVYLLPLFLCVGSCMFAASRSAFIALLLSILFMAYRRYGKVRFIKFAFVCTIVGFLSFPLWKSGMWGLSMKQQAHEDDTEFFDSRAEKYEYRTREFLSSPIYGVGFAAIDTNTGEVYNTETGTIEPGSSWLAVLSMTGIVGFLLFLAVALRAFMILLRMKRTHYSILLASCMLFMFIHWQAEGYIFSAGNPLCFFSWLVLGCGFDQNYRFVDGKIYRLLRPIRIHKKLQLRSSK